MYYGAAFGEGNGSILTEEYDCQGNETSLLDCFKTGYHPYCGTHYQDVGIACGPFVAAGMLSYGIIAELRRAKRASGAPWYDFLGNLSMQEILVITSRTSARTDCRGGGGAKG